MIEKILSIISWLFEAKKKTQKTTIIQVGNVEIYVISQKSRH